MNFLLIDESRFIKHNFKFYKLSIKQKNNNNFILYM